MDRIRRSTFVQESSAITLSDHKMMTCSPANLSAVYFFWELAQQISCMLHGIQMTQRNATLASSQ